MLKLISRRTRPRPHCALFQRSFIPCTPPIPLCMLPKSLTHADPMIKLKQFSEKCNKCNSVKNAALGSSVIRHSPPPSDIKPPMKYLLFSLLLFLSLSCGGSGTSTTQTDQPSKN